MSFDRRTYYAGEQGQTVKVLTQERNVAKSLWQYVADSFGNTTSRFTGLTASAISGTFNVSIANGALYQYNQIDPTSWSTLSADTTQWLLQGLVTSSQTLTGFAAATISGDSIAYLIEAQLQVTDTTAVSTPFYNSSNPSNPTFLMESPSRQNVVALKTKASAQSASPTTPSPDSGWVPIWQVVVPFGASQVTSGMISLAPSAPQFTGFVTNISGTPVYLNPGSQQTGGLNISGTALVGTVQAGSALFGPGAATVTHFQTSYVSGVTGDYANFTAIGWTGSKQTTDSVNISGSIGYTGPHAGTDGDPYPISQLNVAMLGGKVASDYALASGNYIIVYSGTPTLATGNAGVTGYFQIGAATGTAPLVIASTTKCTNLNADMVDGCNAGNASGDVPISNGTLNVNLNAQFLNGLASSAFQLAGNYAAMNTTNSGAFTASGQLASTGGGGSNQVGMGYQATNSWGINGGGAVSYVTSPSAPIGLTGPSVQTNCPVYVGGGTRQNIYMQDVIPSGLLRSGECIWTVTYGGTSNAFPYPGNGTAFGHYSGFAGQVTVSTDAVMHQQFYIGFRTKVIVQSNVSVTFAGVGFATMAIYVDGNQVATVGGLNIPGSTNYTLTAGTHVVDVVYQSGNLGNAYYIGSDNEAQGGSCTLFGWLPVAGGSMSTAIAAITTYNGS